MILELSPWVRSSQGFHTSESSRCSDSNEERRAPVVDCAQVPFGKAAAGKRVPVPTCPVSRLTGHLDCFRRRGNSGTIESALPESRLDRGAS